MYEAFYGFSERPFSLVPDPHYLYLSRRHRAAIDMLELALRGQAGFSTITGEVGSGKTTVARRFLEMPGDDTTIGLITNTHENLGELLQWILLAFGLDQEGKNNVELYETFVDFLFEQFSKGQHTVLLIDEAQNLDVSALEQLRVFSNIYDDQEHVLQIMLIGQPELLDKLNRPELKQLAQRISVNFHLGPLDLNETAAYIRYRMKVAGAYRRVFDEAACAAVYYFTGGIPRLINILCDFALLYGYAEDRPYIDHGLVWKVVYDKTRTGLNVFENTELIANKEGIFIEILKLSTEISIAEVAEDANGKADDRGNDDRAAPPDESRDQRSDSRERLSIDTRVELTAPREPLARAAGVKVRTMKQAVYAPEQKKEDVDLGIRLEEPVDAKGGGSFEAFGLAATILLFVFAGGIAAWASGYLPVPQWPIAGLDETLGKGPSVETAAIRKDLPATSADWQPRTEKEPTGATASNGKPAGKEASTELQGRADTTVASVDEPPVGIGRPLEVEKADVVAATSPEAAVPELAQPTASVSNILESLETVTLEEAGRILLSLWGRQQAIVEGSDPCRQAAEAGLACLSESGPFRRLVSYDRPAILMLRSAEGKISPVVLSAFDGELATWRTPDHELHSEVGDLEFFLSGDYFLFWNPPAVYTRVLREGMSGPDVAWVKRRLVELDRSTAVAGETDLYDAALRERVIAFQQDNGLAPDGIVGPRTMIRLRAVGGDPDGPRLTAAGRRFQAAGEFSGI